MSHFADQQTPGKAVDPGELTQNDDQSQSNPTPTSFNSPHPYPHEYSSYPLAAWKYSCLVCQCKLLSQRLTQQHFTCTCVLILQRWDRRQVSQPWQWRNEDEMEEWVAKRPTTHVVSDALFFRIQHLNILWRKFERAKTPDVALFIPVTLEKYIQHLSPHWTAHVSKTDNRARSAQDNVGRIVAVVRVCPAGAGQ